MVLIQLNLDLLPCFLSPQAHNHTAARGVHSHPHGPPHLGPLGALVMPGSEGAGAPGGVGVPPQVSHPGPPTSSATNINAMFLNQLLASGVTLQAFLGQPVGYAGSTA